MVYFNTIIFLVISFCNINISFQSYIILPFKTSVKVKKEYPENILQNDIEVTLNIGNPPQSVDLNLRSKLYTFFITSVNSGLPFATFNESKSKTLIKETEKPEEYSGMEYAKGYMIYDSIFINGKELKNVSLILATELNYKESGALGLRLVDEHDYGNDLSFIYQIKQLYNFDSYTYMIKYKNDNEGELIIGAYPHMFNKNYSETDFYYTKAGVLGKNVDWILNFDIIKYNNKSIKNINMQGFTQIEFGLIRAPYKVKSVFNDTLINGKCSQRFNIQRNLIMFHCDKNININNFKNLTFVLKDINTEFTLTPEDLFIKYNDEYIFGIVFNFNDNKEEPWILGKIFMKKFGLIYDLDRKIIGLYKGNSTNVGNEPKKNSNLILIILLAVLGIVIIALVIFIVYYIKKQRKNRACELDDDNYEYFPNE